MGEGLGEGEREREEGSKMAASHASASSPQIMYDDVAGANPAADTADAL